MLKYKISTDVATEPVTLDEAKAHIQLADSTDTSEDTYISMLISAARRLAENYTNRRLAAVTVEAYLDDLENGMEMEFYPLFPVVSITSITYKDAAEQQQTLADTNYVFDKFSSPQKLYFKTDLPDTYKTEDEYSRDNVTLTLSVGHQSGDFPQEKDIKLAILFAVRTWYDMRTDVAPGSYFELPNGSKAMLNPYRLFEFV